MAVPWTISVPPRDTVQLALLAGATHLFFKRYEPAFSPRLVAMLVLIPAVALYIIRGALSRSPLLDYTTFFSALLLSIIGYRLSPLHPLAKFPGPTLFKVSKFWGVWIVSQGYQHLTIKSLHDKYGNIVRIGPNELSICDAEAISVVLGTNGLPKGPFYSARTDPKLPTGSLLISVGEEHRNRRRLWGRGMNSESISEYVELISNCANQLVGQLDQIKGPFDLSKWMGYFAFDFMGDMAFGHGFGMLTDSADKDRIWHEIDQYLYTLSLVSQIPWCYRYILRIPWVSSSLQGLRTFAKESSIKRLQAGAKRKDLWYHLTDEAGLEPEKPSTASVIADGTLAIVAGSDTTATVLSNLFYYLLKNPKYMGRAQSEVDAVYPPGSSALDHRQHGRLTFLQACVNESLRLKPPTPTNGPRVVPIGSGGAVILGHHIPENTQVYVPFYSLHRDPRYFSPSPEAFFPERWLSDDPEPKIKENPAFIPFSYGPANCVGRRLALTEILMVSSLLLQRYVMEIGADEDFRANSGWESSLHDHYVFTRGDGCLRVRLTQRN